MTAVFAAAIFLSSALLFWLEPLFGKMVLPFLGGAPPAWNACMLFYQVALIAGYAWAHLSTRVGARRHLVAHFVLSVAALATLPFVVRASLLPPPPEQPLRWVLRVLAVGVGLPFVVLAANGPLLQRAFHRVRSARARDPYFLYAASNLGSAVGLLLYPLVFERYLSLPAQAAAWRTGYVVLLAVVGVCIALVMSGYRDPSIETGPVSQRVPWSRRASWVVLAAIPSSLMLGVTTYISSEVAPVPLIWILPLALYLFTLVAAFSATERLASWVRAVFTGNLTPRWVARTVVAVLVAGTLGALCWFALGSRVAIVLGHLVLFTVAALICHTRLAEARPPASQLTQYYLWMAIGGGVGGAFNTLVGPLIFTSVLEYPLALAAVTMVLPARGGNGDSPSFSAADILWPLGIGAVAAAIPFALDRGGITLPFSPRLLLAGPALAALAFSGRPFRFGGALVAVVAASALYPSEIGSIEHATRNFYSVHRVLRDDHHGFRWLTNGVTVHGGQRVTDSLGPRPLTYYTPSGPAGEVFASVAGARRDIAVIGLGAGSLLWYGRPGQRWTFFEIDPGVIAIAQDRRFFRFLDRGRAPYRIVEGDARLSLARDTAAFDVLVLDAFASDVVPVHLLTREAMRLYLARLKPGGIVLMHISNRFFDLGPIVGVMARDAGLVGMQRHDLEPDDMEGSGKFGSHWVVLARDASVLAPLGARSDWTELVPGDVRVWTDDYSSVVPLLRTRGAK